MADISAVEGAGLWERAGRDDDSFWWAVIGLDKNKAYVQAIGDTDIAQMLELLAADQIQYGIVKIMGVDPKGSVVSKRSKTVFFTWTGGSVSRLKAVQASPVKSALISYFRGHAFALEVTDKSDIAEEDLVKRLRACGGAHQPERFEFGSGSSVQSFTQANQPVAAAGSTKPAPPAPKAAPAPAPKAAPAPTATLAAQLQATSIKEKEKPVVETAPAAAASSEGAAAAPEAPAVHPPETPSGPAPEEAAAPAEEKAEEAAAPAEEKTEEAASE